MDLSNSSFSPQFPDQPLSAITLPSSFRQTTVTFPIHQAPKIIQQLGYQLGFHAFQESLNKIDVSHIQDFKQATVALQQILAQSQQIYEKCMIGESEHPDIASLTGEIHKLEGQLLKLSIEKKLSSGEVQRLQQFTGQLQGVISSLSEWTDFQSAYFRSDDRCEQALASVSSVSFSHLHGCSPAAIQGVQESLHSLYEQIELCASGLVKADYPFAPALVNQLSGAILATTSNVEDWSHELSVRSGWVFQQSLDLWDKAETFEGKQEAASLLLSQQKMLQDLETSLGDLEKLTRRSLEQLPAQTAHIDSAKYGQMRGQLGALAEALASLKSAIPAKRQFADAEILKRSVLIEINKGGATADREAIENRVAQIVGAYAAVPGDNLEQALERYTATKRALLPYAKISKTAKNFSRNEEVRLTALAGYGNDFEGMAHALLLKDKEPAPGIFGRIYQAIHPDNWSDRTKTWIRTTFSVVQLGSHLLNIYQQLSKVPESLSSQDRTAIQKELNLLRNLVTTNKYKVLGNQATFEKLTKRNPEIREALQELVKYSSAPPKELQNQFFDQYAAYRQDVLLGKEAAPPSQWVSELKYLKTSAYQATVLHKSDQLKLGHTAAAAERVLEAAATSMTASKSGVEQLNAASQAMQASQSFLRQCSVAEYIQPKKAVTPQALLELKQEVTHMQRKLRETMLSQPQSAAGPEWGAWNVAVAKQCFAARDLEKHVNQAMQKYEEAMALGSFQQESEAALSVFGNKHLNLIKQANLQSALEMEGIEIPVPQGVESKQMHRFLQAATPELFTRWDMLGKLYAEYKGEEPFVKTDAAAAHLKAIATLVQKAFTAAAVNDEAFQALGLGKEMQLWLDTLAAEGHYLMVRSTGAEDTKKSANAGGNISVAYVKPTKEEFCEALGQVVASYFGAGSLQNRLNAEANPFAEDLKLAVTAQKLIGEPIGGAKNIRDIPISLVLFTNEPLYFGDEEFRAMRISATFGIVSRADSTPLRVGGRRRKVL